MFFGFFYLQIAYLLCAVYIINHNCIKMFHTIRPIQKVNSVLQMNKILTACSPSNPKQFNLIMVQKNKKQTNIYTYAPLVLQEFHSIIKVTVSLVRSLAIRACLKISKEINDLRCLIGQLLYINSITGVHGMHCDMKAKNQQQMWVD